MAKSKRSPFPAKSSAPKSARGRTPASDTPLHIRARGVTLNEATQQRMRERVGRQLGKFAPSIERVSVRVEDVNGPRGGVDTVCKLKVVLSGRESIVAEEVHEDAWQAFVVASDAAARAVKRQLERKGSLGLGRSTRASRAEARAAKEISVSGDGSLIGRRVGRSRENLERAAARPEKNRRDVYVDTSEPKRSASDRRVGAAGTAARNTKLSRAGMTRALEDSASGTPSRKSTRRSANRAKASSNLERREARALTAPQARATRARAAAGSVRGRK